MRKNKIRKKRDMWKTCIQVKKEKKNVEDKANKISNYKNLKEKKNIALQIILQLFFHNCNVIVLWVEEKKMGVYV